MTEAEFEEKYNNWELDEQYAEFIMEHSAGDRIICNGDTLTVAMEEGYLFDKFKDSLVD